MAGENDGKGEYEISIFIASIASLILLITAGIEYFGFWMINVFLSSLLSVFFFAPIVSSIVNVKLSKKTIAIVSIGVIYCVIYSYFMKLSAYDIFIKILQSVITVACISLVVNYIKNKIEEELKEWTRF